MSMARPPTVCTGIYGSGPKCDGTNKNAITMLGQSQMILGAIALISAIAGKINQKDHAAAVQLLRDTPPVRLSTPGLSAQARRAGAEPQEAVPAL
jgi:hypothetical protein